MAPQPKTTPAAARAAIAEHGGIAAAARATGLARTTLRRAALRETEAAAAAASPGLLDRVSGAPGTARAMALPADTLSVLRAAAAALASPAVQALLAAAEAPSVAREAVRSRTATQRQAPPPVATNERPRIRVPARTADVVPVQPTPPERDPLGDAAPYEHEIFGVHARRSPRVGAPVSRQHIRVTAIGDSHFHPGLPQTLRCMSLVGHHVAAKRPEHLVHIGDGSDWSSVCRHTKNDTWKARQKPSVRQDLDNFRENWAALNAPIDAAGYSLARHYCMGNHDAWLETFEDATPEIRGLATGDRNRTLAEAGWTWSDYGEFYFLGGVGFVHVPLNLMGKPAGGAAPENAVATQATHDIVFGHTHRHNACTRPKFGFANKVTVVNTGGSMPEHYVGDYAHNSMGAAMSSGVLDLDIFDGQIQAYKLVTMRELERRYGHLV